MRQDIKHFLLAAVLYYLALELVQAVLMIPPGMVRMTAFLPLVFGLMWGTAGCLGCVCGEFFTDGDVFLLPEVLMKDGLGEFLSQSFDLFYLGACWLFLASYVPYRLWHSVMLDPNRPLFELSRHCFLKFILVAAVGILLSSLFLGLVTDEAEINRLLKNVGATPYDFTLESGSEYARVCFINDLDFALLFGLPLFFFLIHRGFDFADAPKPYSWKVTAHQADIFLVILVHLAVMMLMPPLDIMDDYMALRNVVAACFLLYALRRVPPQGAKKLPSVSVRRSQMYTDTMRIVSGITFFFLFMFLVLDVSGAIQNLDRIATWWQFNLEVITTMTATLLILINLLLKYRNSIMLHAMLLGVSAVFISTLVLGVISIFATSRLLEEQANEDLSKLGLIEAHNLSHSLESIKLSVGSMRDFALDGLESIERLDGRAYCDEYMGWLEKICLTIAHNTDGCIAFYMRCDPTVASGNDGFFWLRTGGRGTNSEPVYQKTELTDMSLYSSKDVEHVGWYYIPVERGVPTWTEPYMNKNIGVYMISYVIPLYVQGRLLGVVGMDVDFSAITDRVKDITVYNHGFAYLTNFEGKVLFSPRGYWEKGQGDTIRESETFLPGGMRLVLAAYKRDVYEGRNALIMSLVVSMLALGLLLSYISIRLASRGITPLLAITKAAKKIAGGDLSVEIPYDSSNELGVLVRTIREMAIKLDGYVYKDELTGVRNTAAYMKTVQKLREMEEENPSIAYAVVVLDVNGLKTVNDTYGHEAGNRLIKAATYAITQVFGNSAVFRVGGDEFVVILQDEAYISRDRLMTEFAAKLEGETITTANGDFPVSIACGMGIKTPERDDEYAKIFENADKAMYDNKIAIKKKLNLPMR